MKAQKRDTRQKLKAVLGSSDLSSSAKLIYCALAEASGRYQQREPDERELEPGQVAATHKELAEMIGMNVKTVPSALRALQEAGLIRVLSRERYSFCGFHERVYEIVSDQNVSADQKPTVPRMLRAASSFLHEALELDPDLSKDAMTLEDRKIRLYELNAWLEHIAGTYEGRSPKAEAKKIIESFLDKQRRPDFQ